MSEQIQFNFQGLVVPHPALDLTDDNTKAVYEIFDFYWRFGADYEVGLDTALSQPAHIKMLAIRHSHIKPAEFTGEERKFGKQATERCWQEWESANWDPAMDAPSYRIPVSDEWVVYCVDSDRTACFLGYVPRLAHQYCANGSPLLSAFMASAENWFQSENRHPMPFEEMPHLFGDKWRIATR
ncbi:hypothetical protein [Aeromonas hydrophila]|uniref:hypothetical protein n=1 Tax=Aeromonas hydrophila TaxID=644 RepID=UPI0010719152|nr:hypothetical protein [Aeromonas hydrophila]EGX6959768.1 hypothetical protein [Aeromonas hydrophila]MCA4701061.1 hypothetical protein [Aeromonas hydrophila]QIO19770.1 hypothetical protein G9455_18745 [Aeromonas hydrophila]USJ75838.1 hypothetical protein LDP97_14490 [Aeromonas hydrophila]UUT49680.1 hypothetical protein MOO39_18290 [Aeromonas hydrophila]